MQQVDDDNLKLELVLTSTATDVESNIDFHIFASLIWYATGVDSLLVTSKGSDTSNMNCPRVTSEDEEWISVGQCDIHLIDVKQVTSTGASRTRYETELTNSSTSTSHNYAIVRKCNVATGDIDTST